MWYRADLPQIKLRAEPLRKFANTLTRNGIDKLWDWQISNHLDRRKSEFTLKLTLKSFLFFMPIFSCIGNENCVMLPWKNLANFKLSYRRKLHLSLLLVKKITSCTLKETINCRRLRNLEWSHEEKLTKLSEVFYFSRR